MRMNERFFSAAIAALLACAAAAYQPASAAEQLMGSVIATEKSKAAEAFLDSAPSLSTVGESASAFEAAGGMEARPAEFDPEANPRVHAIASQLRCLVCANETIAESNAQLAIDLRREVAQQVRAGRTDDEVISFMVERYGDYVLFKPPFKAKTWLLWLGPAAFILLALWAMVRIVRTRRAETARRRMTAAPEAIAAAKAFLRGDAEYQNGHFVLCAESSDNQKEA